MQRRLGNPNLVPVSYWKGEVVMTRAGRAWSAGLSSLVVVACVGSAGCSRDADPTTTETGRASARGQAQQRLQTLYPGTRIDQGDRAWSRVYGAGMTTGATPLDASERFRVDHAPAFGVPADELVPRDAFGRFAGNASLPGVPLMYDRQSGQHRFTLYRYGQMKAGVPVHGAGMQTLVRNAATNPVVWAAAP